MKRNDHMIFSGSAAAVVTPMTESGAIDFPAMEKLLDFQLKHGTDAIVVNGTTGESATLTDEEKLSLIEFTAAYVNGQIPVIAGTGSNCTSHAIELSKKAQALGVAGLLLVTPYYNKASQGGLAAHFKAVADCVELPVILYNVPGRTGVTISPETCRELSDHPNICAIKEAGGDISRVAKIASLCGDNLDIYSGNDDQVVPIMSLGGKGVISVLANIMPGEVHDLCRLFSEGKIKQSAKIQLDLLDLMNALFMDVNPIPVKAALSLMGICRESYRLPLTKMGEAEKERLAEIMKRHSILSFDED